MVVVAVVVVVVVVAVVVVAVVVVVVAVVVLIIIVVIVVVFIMVVDCNDTLSPPLFTSFRTISQRQQQPTRKRHRFHHIIQQHQRV